MKRSYFVWIFCVIQHLVAANMSTVPSITLNNGQRMPVLGLGTWRAYEKQAEEACKIAIEVGYRHIDTAFVYENEHEIGRAIQQKISDGTIKREDIFIVTKLGGIHHDVERVEQACRDSLARLNLTYIDLYLMHFPVGQKYSGENNVHGSNQLTDVDYLATWQAMEKLVDLQLVRSIGLSNFNASQTQRVLDNCRIKPVVNQVECNAGFNQKQLIEFSRARDIVITAYSPLARPNAARKWPPYLFDQTAQQLALKYNKLPAQIALRYLLQLGVVVIPKSTSRKHIQENYEIFDFELSAEDMEIMDKYHTGQRMITFSGLSHHKYYPFNAEF